MRKSTALLLLVVALAFGIVHAERHEGAPSEAVDVHEGDGHHHHSGEEASEGAALEEAAVRGSKDAGVRTQEEMEADFERLVLNGQPASHPNEVARFLASREDLSIFRMLLDQSGLLETLAGGDRPITIFAPSDEAFLRMDRLRFAMLVNDPNRLRAMLERHIVIDRFALSDLEKRIAAGARVSGGGGAMDVSASPTAGTTDTADADIAETDTADVAPPGEVMMTPLPPDAVSRLPTRAGAEIEIGSTAAASRRAAMDASVAGGGAGEATDAEPTVAEVEPGHGGVATAVFVDDARIVESDLDAGGATLHVIDAVLLAPAER